MKIPEPHHDSFRRRFLHNLRWNVDHVSLCHEFVVSEQFRHVSLQIETFEEIHLEKKKKKKKKKKNRIIQFFFKIIMWEKKYKISKV